MDTAYTIRIGSPSHIIAKTLVELYPKEHLSGFKEILASRIRRKKARNDATWVLKQEVPIQASSK